MKTQMYDENTGEPVENPADLNYRITTVCDGCDKRKEGTMFHAAGATGRVCEVLFLCDVCSRIIE